MISACFKDERKTTQAFRTGARVGWPENDKNHFSGTERCFRPNYAANLTSAWISALDGMEARLKAGASVADVGGGHGASTLLVARSYPKSSIYGVYYHSGHIESAPACGRGRGGSRARSDSSR
jgi:cyclopropane fatty-acyl-phospholipid synthase-like methyltransferase